MPIGAVIGIFAKETGYGFSFTAPEDPVASLASSTAPRDGDMSRRGWANTVAQAPVASADRQVASRAAHRAAIHCHSAPAQRPGERALQFPHAGIAQLVEQRFCKPLVVGSIPTAGTSLCHRIPATAATATSKTSRGTGGAGAIATSPEHLCAAGRCHRTLPSTPRPATRHRSRAYECRICEASRSDARQTVLSGNNPGIQREARAAGKARRSGARVLSEVSTPCSNKRRDDAAGLTLAGADDGGERRRAGVRRGRARLRGRAGFRRQMIEPDFFFRPQQDASPQLVWLHQPFHEVDLIDAVVRKNRVNSARLSSLRLPRPSRSLRRGRSQAARWRLVSIDIAGEAAGDRPDGPRIERLQQRRVRNQPSDAAIAVEKRVNPDER